MPITASAKKALRQGIRRRALNQKRKAAVKSAVKTYRRLASAGDTAALPQALSRAYQTLDKTAKSGVITRNKAARLKSRLARSPRAS